MNIKMNLNINSPSYFTEIYGVIDEVYWMCRDISTYVQDKQYSDIVDTIGICPLVAPKDLIEKNGWKEEIGYKLRARLIIVRKYMDFELYVNNSIEGKKKLMVGHILNCIRAAKSKGRINYEEFQKDLLTFLGYTKDDIDEYR